MSTALETPRVIVLRAAQGYQRLAREHRALVAHLAEVEARLRAAYAAVRDDAPAALADCADTTQWEELYTEIELEAGDDAILANVALPLPRDGSRPPSRRGMR
jgi:hypothetical protein